MICNATIQEDNKVPIVGSNMDTKDSISVWLEIAANPSSIEPNTSTTSKNVWLHVRVKVVDLTKATNMEE
jgi:hypothetical protein